jgi:hypothetical protein
MLKPDPGHEWADRAAKAEFDLDSERPLDLRLRTQYLECLVDAQLREPSALRAEVIKSLALALCGSSISGADAQRYASKAWLALSLYRASRFIRDKVFQDKLGLKILDLSMDIRAQWTNFDTTFGPLLITNPAALVLSRLRAEESTTRADIFLARNFANIMAEHLNDLAENKQRIELVQYAFFIGICVDLVRASVSAPLLLDRRGGGNSWADCILGSIEAVTPQLTDGPIQDDTGVLIRYLAQAGRNLDVQDPRGPNFLAKPKAIELVEMVAEIAWSAISGQNELSPALQVSCWTILEARALLERDDLP